MKGEGGGHQLIKSGPDQGQPDPNVLCWNPLTSEPKRPITAIVCGDGATPDSCEYATQPVTCDSGLVVNEIVNSVIGTR